MSAEIIHLRSGRMKVATGKETNHDLLRKIWLLLRRRDAMPLNGRLLTICFHTDVEAAALQKLISALPKARIKRRKSA